MSRAIKLARAGYSGDPGLFGDIWGGIKSVGKAALGVASAVPGIGGIAKVARSVLFRQPAPPRQAAPRPVYAPQARVAMPVRPAVGRGLVLNGAPGMRPGDIRGARPRRIEIGPSGGAVDIDYPAGIPGGPAAAGGPADGTMIQRDDILVAACPSGYRPNKSAYYETSPAGTVIYHPPGTKCVRIQRRNPANARANDRAISRLSSAKRYEENLKRITIRPRACRCK